MKKIALSIALIVFSLLIDISSYAASVSASQLFMIEGKGLGAGPSAGLMNMDVQGTLAAFIGSSAINFYTNFSCTTPATTPIGITMGMFPFLNGQTISLNGGSLYQIIKQLTPIDPTTVRCIKIRFNDNAHFNQLPNGACPAFTEACSSSNLTCEATTPPQPVQYVLGSGECTV